MTRTALRTLLAGLVVAGALGALASPAASAAHTHQVHLPAAGSYHPHVTADDQLPAPPWWVGTCDGSANGTFPGSYRLGADFDGLLACGPGSNEGDENQPEVQFYSGAWGEYEWQCVELSMRWMYLAWGVNPYPADGNTIVDNYDATKSTYNPDGPDLRVVVNGTKGVAPQPGDVLELTDSDAFGHTEVVAASSVDAHGDGTVKVITENLDAPTTGWYTLTVTNWVVDGGFGTVVDWLHDPSWSLDEPLVAELSPAGTLSVKEGGLHGPFTPVETGVASAEVVGGGGSEPAPLLVLLTTSGELEAGYDLPGARLWPLASGVSQFEAASREGPTSTPVIGWLSSSGDFYLLSGSFQATPVLEATGAASIAVGSDSPGTRPLLGYVTPSGRAYLDPGTGTFVHLASGVRTLVLADDGASGADAAQGYIGVAGRLFLRQGVTGRFHALALPPVGGTAPAASELSIALVGTADRVLVGVLDADGDAYASLGGGAPVAEATGATAIEVSGALDAHGFPVLAVESASGDWSAKEGSLTGPFVDEGDATSLSLSSLVVS